MTFESGSGVLHGRILHGLPLGTRLHLTDEHGNTLTGIISARLKGRSPAPWVTFGLDSGVYVQVDLSRWSVQVDPSVTP